MKIQNLSKELSKKYININEKWKFKLGDDMSYSQIICEDIESWEDVNLPHDWSIYLDFNQKSLGRNEAGLLDGGFGYYIKKFYIGEEFANKNIHVKFGGVYMDSTVWINGKMLGNYPFGYNTFYYDMTKWIQYGENTLVVKVENRQPSSRWYSGSGIYRNVELIVKEKINIKEDGVIIRTRDEEFDKIEKVRSQIKFELVNDHVYDLSAKVRYEILDKEGNKYGEFETNEVLVESQGDICINDEFEIDGPKLWSIEEPNLYYIKTKLYCENKLVDEQITRYGYRYMNWDSKEGFHLNGKYLKFHGVCLHHDNGALGAKLDIDADRRKLKIMKDMGVNSIRTSHNPQSEEFIKLCDEMGLLVIEEAFDTWYGNPKKEFDYNRFFAKKSTHPDAKDGDTWAKFDIQRMVKRDINSPSIMMWSIGNEIWESKLPHGLQQGLDLISWIEEIDDTRFTTIGEERYSYIVDEGVHVDISSKLGAVGLNYCENRLSELFEIHPTWRFYGSETSSAVRSRGIYYNPQVKDNVVTGSGDKPNRKYQMSDYGNDRVGWGKTAIDSWIPDRDNKQYAGQFIWTGFDYIGEPTPWHNEENLGAMPKSSYFGIVDTCGFPKADYYFYQSQWLRKEEYPMVKIIPHWNWEDRDLLKSQGTDLKRDDDLIPVRVYSNLEKIDLRLNGKSLGEKSFHKKKTHYGWQYLEGESKDELYLEWFVPYEPGILEAFASEEDIKAFDKVTTSEEANSVKLEVEDPLRLGKTSYIKFSIIDKNGIEVPTAENEVNFAVTGAEIVGVDNGNSPSRERYKNYEDGTWKRKVFSGSGILLIRPTQTMVLVEASSEGLEKAEVNIEVKKTEVINFETTQKMSLNTSVVQDYVPDEKGIITEDIEIFVQSEEEIKLPNKVKIIEDGHSKFVDVRWSKVKKEDDVTFANADYGDKNIRADIFVNEFVEAKGFDITSRRNRIPKLPIKSEIYTRFGEKLEVKVLRWLNDKTGLEITEADFSENTVLIGELDGSDLQAKANVEIIDEEVDSYNYAVSWNGSEIPAGIASYTNEDPMSTDSVISLNNGITSYDRTYKDRWTNISSTHREKDYAGILFGRAGELEKHNIYKVKIAFFEDDCVTMPKEYKLQYFNRGEVTVPSDYSKLVGSNHELDDEANWQDVTNCTASKDERFEILEFDELSTFAIRLLMLSDEKKAIGISEIEVYGKEAKKY